MDKQNYKSLGWVPFLGIVFVALRLMGYIDWAWWVVLAPFWVPLAIVLASFVILGIIAYVNTSK